MVLHLASILFILFYAAIAAFSVYVAVTGREVPGNKKWLGRLLINHGKAIIVIVITTAALTAALVFSKIIVAMFNFIVVVKGENFIQGF